jgi:type VI secretion system protein ImpD
MPRLNRLFLMLPVLIARIDQLVNAQIDAVLHHPKVQLLEASWRGLHLLADCRSNRVRIRLLDLRFDEIHHDLERALDPEFSELFGKIYSEEFDHAGGEPFGLLIGDYAIDFQQPMQMAALRGLSQISASAFAPFVCGVSATTFGIDRFSDLVPAGNSEALLQAGTHQALQSLRQLDNSRFLAIALPRIRLRQCWGHEPPFDGGIPYHEQCRQVDDYLWGNAAFALAAMLAREFQDTGWFAQATGTPQGDPANGRISVIGGCSAAHGDIAFSALPITDVIITDRTAHELGSNGFIAVAQGWSRQVGAFHSLPALHAATHLQHMLCASRIAHHLKIMMRDRIGSHATADDCERLIDSWLKQYTSASNSTDSLTRARFPLAVAKADICEEKSRPGHYRCTLRLQLHHDTCEIESEIQLTTELIRVAA